MNIGGTVTQSPRPEASSSGEQRTQLPDECLINGGVVIPVYVLVLAMIAAGINTTRKVPDIQKGIRHQSSGLSPQDKAPRFPALPVDIRQAHSDVAAVRTELIETYMYFVAAPFLAIAMYYLVLMGVENPSDKVLVLMAFATGFMSDAVVGKIIAFGNQMLVKAKAPAKLAKKENGRGESSGRGSGRRKGSIKTELRREEIG